MGILLGLAAAVGFGSADFLARFSTRDIGTYRSLLYMQLVGLVALTVLVAADASYRHILVTAGRSAWVWTLAVVLLEVVSALALYRSFETGVLSIVSPITSSFAAVTVVLSLLSGEVVSLHRWIGIVLCLVGVVMASSQVEDEGAQIRSRGSLAPGVGWALVAALGFGITFWLFGFQVTPRLGNVVPVWVIRLSTPVALLVAAAPLGQSVSVPQLGAWRYLAAIGALDTAGFLAATSALGRGHIAIVGVIISLFSAVTVLLARIFLREGLTGLQWLGIGVIFVGVTLVSA